ncbi:MAG: hypothetical protein KAU01_02730 [Candidatus Cloacimonetes bacterium]|nr:hypothetical protein [Candidatus Cloacimonadota bacterium]
MYGLLKVYDPTAVTKKLLSQVNLAWKNINKIKDGSVDFVGSTSVSVISGIKEKSYKAVKTTKKILQKILFS